MRSPPLRAIVFRLRAAAGLALLASLAGCAAVAPRVDPALVPAEVLIELLPANAELVLDGVKLGRGGRVLRLPDPGRSYRLRASAPGFHAVERVEPGTQLAGARLALVLRPVGAPDVGTLDLEDGEGLALAAETLHRQGNAPAAREYAERAAAVAPALPRVRRVLEQVRGRRAESTIEVRQAAPGSQR